MTKLNKNQIRELLPHREPMLLIDELYDIKKLFSATAVVNVKKESFFVDFKHKFKSFKIYFLFLLLALYLAFLAKIDPLEKEFLGNGIVYKFSILIFDNFDLSKIFLYLSFFGSISVIYLFIDDIRDYLFIIALILSSIFITPLFQEYYDPIIFMLILR